MKDAIDDIVCPRVEFSAFLHTLGASQCCSSDRASHGVRMGTCHPLGSSEMIRKTLDAFSIMSIAAFLGVVMWLIIWGEEPHVPGHWSTQSIIVLWDIVPCAFGLNWLIFRYAKAAKDKFPLLFGRPGQRGLLFYFALVLFGTVLLERLFLTLSKLMGE